MIILNSFLMLLGLGLLASLMLAVASKIFYVREDPRIEQVEESLLGANCGGCGYAGCAAAAEAVVSGKAKVDVCSAGGFEIARQVAAVMGVKIEEREPDFSRTGCYYGFQDADLKFTYDGVGDCRAAMLLYGGSKECTIGCLGLGTCVRACPFHALSMGENNLPVVNMDRCTGCGVCVEVCPKGIITLSSATRRMMSDIITTECTAPCQRNCPAEIDIPEYIRQISAGDYLEAVRVIKEKNPFPLICGWICPAPCEFECRRNLIDEPVGINALKKFVTEYEMNSNRRAKPPYFPEATGKKIAVIGGGVEGLTAAYYLRRLGHIPTVFEATDKLGGILRYVITEDRLPREVLDWEIEGILELGIEAETRQVLGRDISLDSLFSREFDLVLITTGGWDSKQILIAENALQAIIPGTHLLVDFLIASSKKMDIPVGKQVVILGGGSTASEAAEICKKKGAEDISIVFPFSREDAEFNQLDIPESDRVRVIYSAHPVELTGTGDGLKSLTVTGPDGSNESLPLENLLVGSGRFPEMLFEKSGDNTWRTVEILKALPVESEKGIFTIGESGRPSDLAGVVVAVRRGRKMARGIRQWIAGEEITPESRVLVDEKEIQNVFEIANADPLKAPRGIVENLVTLSEAQARYQAQRCLNCGLLCYKKSLDEIKQESRPGEKEQT